MITRWPLRRPSLIGRASSATRPLFVALGSVGIEPFWLFYRSELEIDRVTDLAGLTLTTEGTGTTSYQVANLLVDQVGLADRLDIVPLTDQTTARSIQGFDSGTIDALFLSGQADSHVVQSLLKSDHAAFCHLTAARLLPSEFQA